MIEDQTLTTKSLARLLCGRPIEVAYVCSSKQDRAFASLALCVALEDHRDGCSVYTSGNHTLKVSSGSIVYFRTTTTQLRGLKLDLVVFDDLECASQPFAFELAHERLRSEDNLGVMFRGR